MRGCVFAIAALVAAGCSASSSSGTYTYPGCSASSGVCASNENFTCAQATLRAKYDACDVDADCALVTPAAPCTGGCTAAINATRAGAFNDELLNESQRFCSALTDASSRGDVCQAPIAQDCFGSFGQVAACDAGRCIMVLDPDAGVQPF